MTLQEVVSNVFVLNNELTVYCNSKHSEWTPETVGYLLGENEAGGIVIQRDSQELYYFLEVDIILEVIEGWQKVSQHIPSPEELLEVVIYYAQNDAWPLSS